MRLPELAHEVTQVKCFARARPPLKDREAIGSATKFCDKALMPFSAAAAVMKGERFGLENRVGGQGDLFGPDRVAVLLDKIKSPAVGGRGQWLGVFLAKLCYQPLGFSRGGGETNNPVLIGIKECPGAELKGEIVPFLRSVFGVFGRELADGAEQNIGMVQNHPVQIP